MPVAATISKTTYRAGSQFADIEQSHIAGEDGLPRIIASGYTGALSISDLGAGGSFALLPGFTDRWDYTPANRSQNVTIRVTDAGTVTHVDKALAVVATFPFNPNVGYDVEPKTYTKLALAKDNTPKFRRPPKKSFAWTLTFANRTIMDLSVIQAFFDFHDIDIPFDYSDIEIEQIVTDVRFDSEPKWRVIGPNQFEITCMIKAHSKASLSIRTKYRDTIPPTVPTGLAGVATGPTSIHWSWDASIEDDPSFGGGGGGSSDDSDFDDGLVV